MTEKITKSNKDRTNFIILRDTPRRKKLIKFAQFQTGIYSTSRLFDAALAALIKHARVQKQKKKELDKMDLTELDTLLEELKEDK